MRYQQEFQAIVADAEALTAGLTDGQFNWRPGPGRWAISECLGHLCLSGGPALAAIDRLISQAQSEGWRAPGAAADPLLGRLFVWMMEPPYRMRSRTMGALVPPVRHTLAEGLGEFLALQAEMQRRVERAEGLDLVRPRERLFGPVTLSLGQWFGFTAAHERRHLWQARQVRQAVGFPGG